MTQLLGLLWRLPGFLRLASLLALSFLRIGDCGRRRRGIAVASPGIRPRAAVLIGFGGRVVAVPSLMQLPRLLHVLPRFVSLVQELGGGLQRGLLLAPSLQRLGAPVRDNCLPSLQSIGLHHTIESLRSSSVELRALRHDHRQELIQCLGILFQKPQNFCGASLELFAMLLVAVPIALLQRLVQLLLANLFALC